jgi:hypothetical protein
MSDIIPGLDPAAPNADVNLYLLPHKSANPCDGEKVKFPLQQKARL